MEPTDVLTVDEVRSGISATLDLRRYMTFHAAKLGGFMAACGLAVVVAGYIKQDQVSPWAFLLPVGLAALGVFSPLREVRRLTKLLGELRSVEQRVSSGAVVRVQDVPGLRPAA